MKNLIFIWAFLIVVAYANVIGRRDVFEFNEQILITFPTTFDSKTIQDCGSGNPEYILQISYLEINPDPPQKGQQLSISAKGYLSEEVGEGSYIDLTVKLGLIKLLHQRLDLCEQVEKVDKKCPLEEGEQTLEHTVTLPREIPPGKYIVDVYVKTPDHRPIACFKATAFFRP
ncbi:ML domain-containing protein [Gigaspora margarita]|uniref:Phosphatidylglycerol/phosphatidylinositol transfer protein n=2 Tax=Gigaspora margarita TaxID=4874 RepID=A0A8H4EI87_GIGMA|nr:ML domain-containing protein [Gigaspora margarita]